ncbi:hypothetical protein [Blastococcus sp. TF02A-26]|uniref:hypothetical protein n=1 Tax=Blastococcus sp. TF02A-26 TaxID=2250577 RepID=UPI000DEABE48|nr:hypothetical protein [Blastococcus sp. TF02A-26]RBY86027.1 hypothetical protein DQ240_11490 [Blastococcus sp. TF02A-26]
MSPSQPRPRAERRAGAQLVAGAGAELGCGEAPEVRVLPDGRLWLADVGAAVSAVELYRAARGVLAAGLDAMARVSGQSVEEVTFGWLVSLQMDDLLAALDQGTPEADAA